MKGLSSDDDMGMVSPSRIHQIKTNLGLPKDGRWKHEANEIYKIKCSDWWKKRERDAKKARKNERKNGSLKSMVARHIIEKGPSIIWDNLKVVREDAEESLAILRDLKGNRSNHNTENMHSKLLRKVANETRGSCTTDARNAYLRLRNYTSL